MEEGANAVAGGESEMVFGEFLEGLAAVALYRYPDPFTPLAIRFAGPLTVPPQRCVWPCFPPAPRTAHAGTNGRCTCAASTAS